MSPSNRAITPADHQRQRYQKLVRQRTPPKPVVLNCVRAFLVGGALCALGQIALDYFKLQGLEAKEAATWTATLFLLLGAVLTGIGVYDDLGKVGGMGAALPISGFGNSIVAPAMEFRREGWVLGVGSRIFAVAGPVILYGLASATAVAAIKHLVEGLAK